MWQQRAAIEFLDKTLKGLSASIGCRVQTDAIQKSESDDEILPWTKVTVEDSTLSHRGLYKEECRLHGIVLIYNDQAEEGIPCFWNHSGMRYLS